MDSIIRNGDNGIGVAMDWDGRLNNSAASKSDKLTKILMPEGEHSFTVTGLEKGYFSGSARLPACNMATVSFAVDTGDGRQSGHEERFYLVDKMEWKISDFFCSIGLAKRGVESIMRWNEVVGQHGRAHFIHKDIDGKTGTITVNVLDHFIDADAPTTSAPQGEEEDFDLPDLA